MINNILLTILLLLVIVYINKESINSKLSENFNPNVDGGNTSLEIGDTVYFKTDIIPIPNDKTLCATDDGSSRNLIVEGKICSIQGETARLKYTSIINPNINDKCKDKYSYSDIKSVPKISRTADGVNNNISIGDQTKYIGGIKMDGSPECGVPGTIYKRKSRYERCTNSDECGPEFFCYEGDNRCMEKDRCEIERLDKGVPGPCKAMPKSIETDSFPMDIPFTKLSRNIPFNLSGNEENMAAASNNMLLNAYYQYDRIANKVEDVNKKLEDDLRKNNIINYADNISSNFSNRAGASLELSKLNASQGNAVISRAQGQRRRQTNDKDFRKNATESIINDTANTINNVIQQNTSKVIQQMPSIIDTQFNINVNEGINKLNNSRGNVKLVEDTYTQMMNGIRNNFKVQNSTNIMSGLEKSVKDAIDYKKIRLPREDLSNYRGVLVRTYNSNSAPNSITGIQTGELLDEKIVPSINYFMTDKFDSFFTDAKTSTYRYLEFFGNLNFPNTAEVVEFNIVAGSGIRFYFGGELQIDEYSNSIKIDHYSRLNYLQPNTTIPYKIIAYEGNDTTNSHLIFKWRLNRKGNFNVIPSEHYFLPNLKYD
jgi:hypothetical protein